MSRIARLAVFAVAFLRVLSAGSATAGESPPYATPVKPVPPVVHGYCYADASLETVYFSAAFSTPPKGGPGGTTHQDTTRIRSNTNTAWRVAFEAHLQQKYDARGLTLCAMEDSLPQAQASRQALLDKFKSENPGYTRKRTFVETGWAPTSAP